MAAKKKPAPSPPVLAPLPVGTHCLLSRREVARALGGITTHKLNRMIAAGEFPKAHCRIGTLPRWSLVRFNEWVEQHLAEAASQPNRR